MTLFVGSGKNGLYNCRAIKGYPKLMQFYDQGHRIVYWTARGTISIGICWEKLTKKQFLKPGA